jgi:hypothetical protein
MVLKPQLKYSGMVFTLASGQIPSNFPRWGSVCAGNGVNVKLYAHPEPKYVLKHFIYVSHGCGMQFERFYSLNQSIVV